MRYRRVLMVFAVFLVALITYGCGNLGPQSGIMNENMPHFPGFAVGSTKPTHRIAYVWSHDCTQCLQEFDRNVIRYYYYAGTAKKVVFAFLEYETNPSTIKNYTIPAICGGREFYHFYVRGFFAHDITMPETRKLAEAKNIPYKGCADSEVLTDVLPKYFQGMKQQHPEFNTQTGTYLIDGVVATSDDVDRIVNE